MEDLADAAPALSTSLGGQIEVTITIPAVNLRQAVATALSRVGAHGEPVGVEALPEDVRDARLDIPPIPELVTMPQAAQILGVSRQATVDMVTAGKLHAVTVGTQRIASQAAVHALAQDRKAQGITPRGPKAEDRR